MTFLGLDAVWSLECESGFIGEISWDENVAACPGATSARSTRRESNGDNGDLMSLSSECWNTSEWARE